VHLGCWISPCYSLLWLGAPFETYEPFISLIFQFFFFWGGGGHVKLQILNQWIWGHNCIYKPDNMNKRKDNFLTELVIILTDRRKCFVQILRELSSLRQKQTAVYK